MNVKRKPAKIQASDVCYELHTLGWKAFQNLCVTIIGEVFGQTVQSFFDSRDGGRDGAFQGRWKPTANESWSGSFTVQCKFTAKAGKHWSPADLKGELAKAAILAKRGLADNYLLFTNAHVSGATDAALRHAFEAVPGIQKFATFGLERISQIIRESSRLRMLVPRVYGLGDLGQILDERAYAQAREILSALGDDLAKLVITDAYRRSAQALIDHGFVLLLGEPACGKSTIAAALAVASIDEWRCSTLKVRDADDFVAHSNPHEPKQFFWVDDAFGATQCDWQSVASWNRVFPHIQAAIKRGARVLFTSRDYVYNAARNTLKVSAFPVVHESQVVIQVEKLSSSEKEQILYNHIRLGTQPQDVKSRLKPLLSGVAAHQRFSPEIARRLGSVVFTKSLIVTQPGIENFVEHPKEFLCGVIRNLDTDSRTALAVIFMREGALASPIVLNGDEGQAVELLGGSISGIREALAALDGTLVLYTISGGSHFWRFKHPTIRDAFASLISEDHELMHIYLAGTPIKMVFREVTCGDVGIEGVKVVVPSERYEALIQRMSTLNTSKEEDRDALHSFLSYRCDASFLRAFVGMRPGFIAGLRVHSYLSAVSDVDVLACLHEAGILPEEIRSKAVLEMRDLAVSTPDDGFLRENLRAMFTDDEFEATMDDVRRELLTDLDSTISDWRWNCPRREDPESYFESLTDVLKTYRKSFETDKDAVNLINEALSEIDSVVEELRADQPDDPDNDDFRGSASTPANESDRSVFDDVDQ
ncbi:hypothetical protein [Prosthecobacter sp.]|uniref:nSTAND3 domain-containing NTPase n=1 Tax=Prosthecobacter sp. TaxID=1965333 RepID=UPI002AB9646D|nr:hypothetical protein [Prosthecobacter sp.]MDZ4401880.1 hypothetical protein [Prosthecobacter sp.]